MTQWIKKQSPWLLIITCALTRMTLGGMFLQTGYGKVTHLPKVTTYFTSLGVPFPAFTTPVVSVLELIFGVTLFLGLATRLSTIPLIGILLGAIRATQWPKAESLWAITDSTEFLYILCLLWILCTGPMSPSLDAFLGWEKNRT